MKSHQLQMHDDDADVWGKSSEDNNYGLGEGYIAEIVAEDIEFYVDE